MKVELLSPAKDKETAFAAIDCGADAVYIGAPAFSARKSAPNSIEDIKETADYAHKFRAKVYAALNTILSDTELDKAVNIIRQLDEAGVDGVIIQDMGLLNRLIKLKLPIPVHISTQCDNYLPEKVKFFNDIGVSRVILARELSIEQIRKIHSQNPELELESFIHGALCVSRSGCCYLSCYIGGRSANRGECAQPCRKKYSLETTGGKVLKKDFYALCLKDFNASAQIDELINAGVVSLKIEGRLKDTGYVKNVTAYYARMLKNKSFSGITISIGSSKTLSQHASAVRPIYAGCSDYPKHPIYPFEPNLEKSFNRGFTEYFLNGRTDCFNFDSPKSKGEYIGEVMDVQKDRFRIKTDKIIHPQDGLVFGEKGFLVNKVSGDEIYPGMNNKSIIKDLHAGEKIYRNFDSEFEKELQKPVKRQIGVKIEVTEENLIITDEDNIFVKATLKGEQAQNSPKMKENFVKQMSKTGNGDFYIKDIKIAGEIPFMTLGEINKIRREIFSKLMEKRLEIYRLNKTVQKEMKYAQYPEKEVDFSANVYNREALEFYKKCGCRVNEPALEKMKPQRQIALMRCNHCIKYALDICQSQENLVLTDEYGKSYPLRFDCKNCEMFVLSPD